jgi:glycolate oxidase iron-sulfur subunit
MSTGRASFLDPEKALACVHCGLCLGSCPTYLETGNENDSPRGRIYLMRAIEAGRAPLSAETVRHLDLCLGCRACEVACPSGVQYGALLEHTRDFVEHHYQRPWFQRLLRRVVIEQLFPHPKRLRLALVPARIARSLKLERFLPRTLRDSLALLPEHISSTPIPEFSPATIAARGRVGLIRGCVMSVLFGDTNAATVRLLNRAGFEVVVPPAQGCCGALYAHGGNLAQARAAAQQNIAAFESLKLDFIVINAAGCGSTLKEYSALLAEDPAWQERAAQFGARVRDLVELVRPSDFRFGEWRGGTVTYHDACHLAHAQRLTRAPRDLVQAVAGKRFVELPEAEVCCGSAGSYNLTEPEMAERLQRRKTENILRIAPEIVVTTNPGCLLQMRAGLAQAGQSRIQVVHIADFLETALRDPR